MALADLDDGVLSKALLVKVSVQGVPDGERFVVLFHLDLVLDVRDDDGDGLVVDVADVVAGLDGRDDVSGVDVPDVGSCPVQVDCVEDVGDLVVRDDDLSVLWVDAIQCVADGLREVIEVLLRKDKGDLLVVF